jgi:hypothetical protein
MVGKSLYEVFWVNGLEPELIYFLDGLNWFYVIMFTIILYGFKHTDLLDWFEGFWGKFKKYTFWFAAIVTAIVFIFFRWMEGEVVNAAYISGMLRSIVFTVVFSGIFVDIPVYIIKGLGKFIDSKNDKNG